MIMQSDRLGVRSPEWVMPSYPDDHANPSNLSTKAVKGFMLKV